MSSLRQTSDGGVSPDQLPEIGTESVWIEVDNPDGEPIESVIDDEYPFEQREYRGTVYYREVIPSVNIETDPDTYNFRYRSGSGLFIIEGDIPGIKARKIFAELNDSLSELSANKLLSISSTRLGEWSFLFRGSDIPQYVAEDIYGNEVPDEELAELSDEEIAHNYILNRGRAVFYCEGERVNVSYERGILNFTDNVSPEAREWVIQQFEKHVVHGDVLDELNRE